MDPNKEGMPTILHIDEGADSFAETSLGIALLPLSMAVEVLHSEATYLSSSHSIFLSSYRLSR